MSGRNERLRELLETKERRKPELLRRKGVVGVGVGRDELVVFARRGVPVEREIEGRPVRVERTEKFHILLMEIKEKIAEPEPAFIAAAGLTKREYAVGHFKWALPLHIPKKYHAPFLDPVSGAQIGQEWGILDDENTHRFAGYSLFGENLEVAHTRYANGDYSIKGYDVLGPGWSEEFGGYGDDCAGIRLKITDGIIDMQNHIVGKTLGTCETSNWKLNWNRFIFDNPIPVRKGQHYILWFKAKTPMPPIKLVSGWSTGYDISTSKQSGFMARPAFKGKMWSLDEMDVILREWVVSATGTLCTDCTTREECVSNGCVWWGPAKILDDGYWWRYPCHSFPKRCSYHDNKTECEAVATCAWEGNSCWETGGIPITPPERTGRNKNWRPAPPGVEIGYVKAPGWGTFTAVVLKNGVKKILSCRHVLAYGEAPLNATIAQPLTSVDKIGNLEFYVHLKEGVNEVDCALAKLDNQGDVVPGVLLNDDAYSPNIIPTGVGDAYTGQKVIKSGAKTGVRKGAVISTETSVIVDTELGERTYEGCIVTPVIGVGGDSGSILLDESTKEAVGMLFAGSSTKTVHIPMKKTLSALGCTLYTEGAPPYVPPPPSKTYMDFSSSPTNANIWLKKH